MNDTFPILAITLAGLEQPLKEEMNAIGAQKAVIGVREVAFEGTLETLYRANMHSRLAVRLLVPLITFDITDENDLYNKAKAYNWNNYLDIQMRFNVEGAQVDSPIHSSKFIAFRVKDAIVDRFRDQFGKRPFVDEKKPDIVIHVLIKGNQCTLSLDSSGMPLNWRSYRVNKGVAPLNEVLAAGLLKLSGWNPDNEVLHDPMCGSGTLLIEAAMMASHTAPGLFRARFGFQNWKNYEPGIWRIIQRKAREEITSFPSTQLSGADINEVAIHEARENIRNAGFGSQIIIETRDFIDAPAITLPGLIVIDAPFAKYIDEGDLTTFYRKIGSTLKLHYPGFRAFVLSPDRKSIHQIGLKPDFSMILYNGHLTSQYNGYNLYHKSDAEKETVG